MCTCCSSSSQILSPAAGLISSSQLSLSSLPACENSDLTKFTSARWNTPFVPNFHILRTIFQKLFLFNHLNLEGETIPPNEAFRNFTRPHPCQEICFSFSFLHLHISRTKLQNRPFLSPVSLSAYDLSNVKLRLWEYKVDHLSGCLFPTPGAKKMWCIPILMVRLDR